MTMLLASIQDGILMSTQFLVFAALAFCGLVGLGISAMFGGDHDAGIGHDLDHSHDTSGHDGSPSLISPKSFMAFMLGFGASGAGATAFGCQTVLACTIGFITGFAMALIAWSVAYVLYKQQANSSIKPGQSIGCAGTVVTAIREGGIGEVNVSIGGQIIPLTAVSHDGKAISSGKLVQVIQDLGDRVVVK